MFFFDILTRFWLDIFGAVQPDRPTMPLGISLNPPFLNSLVTWAFLRRE